MVIRKAVVTPLLTGPITVTSAPTLSALASAGAVLKIFVLLVSVMV